MNSNRLVTSAPTRANIAMITAHGFAELRSKIESEDQVNGWKKAVQKNRKIKEEKEKAVH